MGNQSKPYIIIGKTSICINPDENTFTYKITGRIARPDIIEGVIHQIITTIPCLFAQGFCTTEMMQGPEDREEISLINAQTERSDGDA
jgi:hypothetical protein